MKDKLIGVKISSDDLATIVTAANIVLRPKSQFMAFAALELAKKIIREEQLKQ